MDTVYLIHFDKPYRHAQHYLGYSDALEARLAAHANSNPSTGSGQVGARLIEVITRAGITWQLARTWAGERALERRLKRQKNSPRLCPICNGGKSETDET